MNSDKQPSRKDAASAQEQGDGKTSPKAAASKRSNTSARPARNAAKAKPAGPRRGPATLREEGPVRAPRTVAARDDFDDLDMQQDEHLGADEATELTHAAAVSEEAFAFADVIDGAFDADVQPLDDQAVKQPYKRVLLPDAEQPKLHKVLAQAGVGSRLEMEALIVQGRVTVNDSPAHVGQRVQYGDQVKINGKPVRVQVAPPPPRVLAYHKVAGEMVTRDDPLNRPTVFRKLPRLMHGKWQAVGRLDLNTEGLLLFTNSGDLANRLMHPRFGLEREYAVRILGALSEEEKERLLTGVMLEDGEAAFGSILDGGGEGVNQWYKVTISEGRNREVRRMMEAVGHAVSRLIRIRYGSVILMRGLRRGMWTDLGERDVARLMDEAGMVATPQGAGGKAGRPVRGGRPAVRPDVSAASAGGGEVSAELNPAKSSGRGAPQESRAGGRKASQGYIGESGVRNNLRAGKRSASSKSSSGGRSAAKGPRRSSR